MNTDWKSVLQAAEAEHPLLSHCESINFEDGAFVSKLDWDEGTYWYACRGRCKGSLWDKERDGVQRFSTALEAITALAEDKLREEGN